MTPTNNPTLSIIGRNLAMDESFQRWLDREIGLLDRTTQRQTAYAWLCSHFEVPVNLNGLNQDKNAYTRMQELLELVRKECESWGLPTNGYAHSIKLPLVVP